MRKKLAIKNLREIKEVFDKLGIEYWLDWGTLLGAVRDGKIIEWDHDMDLGTMKDNLGKIVFAFHELEKRGFYVVFENLPFRESIYFERFGISIGITQYSVKGNYALSKTFVWPKNITGKGLYILYELLVFPKELVIMAPPKYKFILEGFRHYLCLLPLKLKRALSDLLWSVFWRTCDRFGQIIVPKHFFEKLEATRFYGMTFNIPSDVEDYLEYHYGENWKTPKKEWKFEMDNAVKTFTGCTSR